MDVYAGNVFEPIGELMGPFPQWAAQRPKPIMIGEFGVPKALGVGGAGGVAARRGTHVQGETAD